MSTVLSRDGSVAIDTEYYWRPIHTCPTGVKVQLKGGGGVAVYGVYKVGDPFWIGWAPVPKDAPEQRYAGVSEAL